MRYLIVGPSWVGDMVMAQSLFKALCAKDSQAEISVLAPAATHPLLARMPEVTEAILSPITHGKLNFSAHRTLGKSLKDKFDQAIVLPGSLKSALIPFFSATPKRTGWKGEMRFGLLNDLRHLDKNKLPLMVDQYIALTVDDGEQAPERETPSLETDSKNQKKLCEQLALDSSKKILAFCPGAEYGSAKRWPAALFANLAKKAIADDWQVWLFGGPNDVTISEEISNTVKHEACVNLAGKTSLLDAVDLLALADTVVSNDSGLMHVGCALNKKVVVLYGSSSAEFTPPLSGSAKSLSIDLDCSPCFERECPLRHLDCLNKLSPDLVYKAINELRP
jgi:heptosyltransferase-2